MINENFTAMKTNFTSSNSITFDYGKKTVPFEEITYFKSEFGNYTKVFMQENRNFLSSFTLKYYTDKLDEIDTFIVPRKGLMVNKAYVKMVDQSNDGVFVVMENGERFKVSRRRKEEIVKQFA